MTGVTMYTLSTCPWCRKAKRFFEQREIPFECTDYDLADDDEQERIMDDMLNNGGTGQFPYVRIDDHVVVGWNPAEYARLLGLDE